MSEVQGPPRDGHDVSLAALPQAMRGGAARLRVAGERRPGKASLYEFWARHLEEDARTLTLLAELVDDGE